MNNTLEKWEEQTLGEICEKISAGGDKPDIFSDIKTDTCCIPIYSNGIKDNGLYGYTDKATIDKPAITVSARGTIGYVCKRLQPYCPIVRLISLIPKDYIDLSFLAYAMNLIIPQNTGTSIPQLTVPTLKTNKIKYPNIEEQKRIVGILDEAFENIEKAKQNTLQNLNNAKELFESYLTSILINKDDWDKKKLSEVCIDFGRGRSRHRPRNDKKLYGGQYPFIQTGDIRNSDHFITEYTQTYNEVGLAQSKLWPKGTLCITIAANIAETGVLTFDACFPDSVIGCVFDETKTNIDYVEYLLQSFKAILQAEGKGSAQDNINLGTFEKQYFPFPDKPTQDKIVNKLDNMRKNIANLEQIYTQKLQDLDELKQSILQKAFNGEL